jgi:hypothetical protein
MSSSPSCIVGGVFAVIYLGCAIYVVASDRTATGGGWITLHGMATFLVTFPVSAPLEFLGMHLDHRRNLDMVVAVGGSAGMVYLTAAGITSLFRFN